MSENNLDEATLSENTEAYDCAFRNLYTDLAYSRMNFFFEVQFITFCPTTLRN